LVNRWKVNEKPLNHYEGFLITEAEISFELDGSAVAQTHICSAVNDAEIGFDPDDVSVVQHHQNIAAADNEIEFIFEEIYPTYEEGGFLFVTIQEKKPTPEYTLINALNTARVNEMKLNEGVHTNAMYGTVHRFSLEPIIE